MTEKVQPELGSENQYLELVTTEAKKQMETLKEKLKLDEEQIISLKEKMREDDAHSITNLYSADGFYDLVEVSQSISQVNQELDEQKEAALKIRRLEHIIDAPYFARIDFTFDGEDEPEKIYIGKASLTDDAYNLYIYDWRAQISSLYYRFGLGRASYKTPQGKIDGEITLKRQYEFAHGELEYYFDSDVQIVDEFLRKMLSQNTSNRMKTIVETIQRDQDLVIRDMDTDLLMVQGAAGSGKTSIGLHRTAYLMYRGLSARLSSQDIVIISPNTLFEQYISKVLPELGEKNAVSYVFEEIFENVLDTNNVQSKNQYFEKQLTQATKREELAKKSLEFKTSNEFIEIIERYLLDIPRRWLEFTDIYYDGKLIADRELLKNRVIYTQKSNLLGVSLKKLEQLILEKVHEIKKHRIVKLEKFIQGKIEHRFEVKEYARMLSIIESTSLMKIIKKFTELDVTELYKRLFSDKEYFNHLAKGIELPDCIDQILEDTAKSLKDWQENEKQGSQLQYEDAAAMAYLHLKIFWFDDYKNIKQVVLDEAQDYAPVHFKLLGLLFPYARYTILGDINQTIGKSEDLSLYDQISKILNKKNSRLVTMNKSFRCTNEILAYSNRFIGHDMQVESFSRSGEVPEVYRADSQDELERLMLNEVLLCKENGYQSIGLICKTAKEAEGLYERLKKHCEIKLVVGEGSVEPTGTFIIPVYLSKGLEFDAVLLCGTDSVRYHSAEDKKLLYIGCTRALHRLNLFYTGEISPLL